MTPPLKTETVPEATPITPPGVWPPTKGGNKIDGARGGNKIINPAPPCLKRFMAKP